MLGICAAVAAVALGAGASGVAAAEPVEIDRVVAVIRSPAATEPHVVTLSRLVDETRIALVSRGALLAATGDLDGAALSAGLQWVIDQILLLDEATRLQVFQVEPADAAAELARFRSRFPAAADFEAFLGGSGLTPGEVEVVLARSVRVRRYLDSRVSHAAQVSEGEIRAWLDEHAAEIGTRDREVARAHLAERRVATEVQALVRDLRARAEVRVLGDFGKAGRTAPGAAERASGSPGMG